MTAIVAAAAAAAPWPARAVQPQPAGTAIGVPIRDIAPTGQISGRLDPEHGRPYDDYRLHLEANATVRIEMVSPTPDTSPGQSGREGFDTYIDLRSPDGRSLASNDDRGDGSFNSRLVFTAPSAGDYIIRARPLLGSIDSDEDPTYLLSVAELAAAPDPLPLSTNPLEDRLIQTSPQMESFGRTNRYAVYWFEGVAGERIQAELASDAPEGVIQIIDARGRVLAANAGNSANMDVVSVLPVTGRYLIRVQAPADRETHFTLSLERAQVGPRERTPEIDLGSTLRSVPITLQSNVSLKTDGSGEADFFFKLYSLRVRKDHPVTMTLDATGFQPVLEAGEVDTLGFVSWVSARSGPDGNARLVLRAYRNGRVYVRVRSEGLALGSFTLQTVEGVSAPAD